MRIYSFFAFCILIGLTGLALGFWQLERLQQKQVLLEKLKTEKISISGQFRTNPKENFLLAARKRGLKIENRLLRILHSDDGRAVLVDVGWVEKGSVLQAMSLQINGTQVSILQKGYFTPENNLNHNQWYYINTQEMSQYSGVNLENYYISTDENLWQKIPNNHLQYAITWFCLGLIFLGCPFFARKNFS